ncbi:MAG: DNA mismatch repair protein MutS [Oscillospiraceae bacterium]
MPLPNNTIKLSPMMRQYCEIKRQHMDELLLYRLGDFYELFFDDALVASRELELVLTGRDCGLDERAPMCGVPHHSSEGYVAKLIAKGYRVAICDQMEDPALAKGIVKREIVRVVTPGTVTDECMLSEGTNNYICCIYGDKNGFGLCFADITTGQAHLTETPHTISGVTAELARFAPSEIVCNAFANNERAVKDFARKTLGVTPYLLYDANFEFDSAKGAAIEQFGAEQCDSLIRFSRGCAVKALGALTKYLCDTQFRGAARLVKLETYTSAQYMNIPASARRNLELVSSMRTGELRGSLLWVIDRTKTAMGRRMLRSFIEKPLVDFQQINRRLDAVDELYNDTVLLAKLRESLGGVFDVERIVTRVLYRSCLPRELVAFAAACCGIAQIKELCAPLNSSLARELRESIDTLDDLHKRICETLVDEPPALLKDGGYIRPGFSAEADELRELQSNNKAFLSRMEIGLREKTGIKNLKVGYNRVFGYYIEISRQSAERVPDNFIRKQTLTTGERYITEELKELETRILGARERLDVLERRLYDELLRYIESAVNRVQRTSSAVAYIDTLCSNAFLARDCGYCRPEVDDGDAVVIENGRHPVVERVTDDLFVPNDTRLDPERLVAIITGPNMAGKSTYMRQTALIVLLAQTGSFVPAAAAKIGVVDALFTRVGATDDLFGGDSTFMVEMKEVSEILASASERSLVILDEIGRGTSTFDGMSLARAVVEHIVNNTHAKTLFATHYHELTDLAGEFSKIHNYNIAVKKRGDDITFLRRIIEGAADESYGIEVAKLAGLPEGVIERAKEVLYSLEEKSPSARVATVTPCDKASDRITRTLRELSVECLTPIEAMCELNELKKLADERESADAN